MYKKKNKKVGLGMHLLAYFIFFLLIFTVIGIFTLYWKSLGEVSSQAADWGSFGSLLSGVFTLVAAAAASAAFWISHKQWKGLLQFQKKQEESLEFDRYLKHRELFSQLCIDIERRSRGRLVFTAVDTLYRKLFPRNSPKQCRFELGLRQQQEMRSWAASWERNQRHLEKPEEVGRASTIVWHIRQLARHLEIAPNYSCKLNEFYFEQGQEYLKFGIYDFYSFHNDIALAIKELARFCDCDIEGMRAVSLNVSGLVHLFHADFKALASRGGLVMEERFEVLGALHDVYQSLQGQSSALYSHGHGRALWESIAAAFESSEKMERYLSSIKHETILQMSPYLRSDVFNRFYQSLITYQSQSQATPEWNIGSN